MGAAESGKKIVKRLFVPQIDRCEAQDQANLFSAQQVVGTHTQSKEISRGNPGGIVISVEGSVRWDSQSQGATNGISALCQSLARGCKSVSAEQTDLGLLIRR